MSEFIPDKLPPRVNGRYETKSKFVPDKMVIERDKIDRNPNRLVKFTKTGGSDKNNNDKKYIVCIDVGNRHEYWESDVYEKHLKEPCCGSWHPYYVCYTYDKESDNKNEYK